MIESHCPICNTQHEIEIIDSGIDNDLEWTAFCCKVTGKEFEMGENRDGRIGHSHTPGRVKFWFSRKSPSTMEQIPEKSAFDLAILDRVSLMIGNIPPPQNGQSKERYLSQFVEILAQNLKALFVGIYLLDQDENWLSLQVGNHEMISSILNKHAPKHKVIDHKNYFKQAGAALYTGEIRFVHWMTGYIIGYKIVDGQVHENIVKDYAEPFESPWYGDTELYFPLQNHDRKIGVLEFTFNTSPWISHAELLNVQLIANQLAMVLSKGENA